MKNVMTAIPAIKARKWIQLSIPTYANILLRPQPRAGTKDSPILLNDGEVYAIFNLLNNDLRKWNWVVGREHTRYIYMAYENGDIKITSVSGYYSGAVKNQFNVIGSVGNRWLKVETIKAGSDWWKDVSKLPSYLLHHVYSFKEALPKCGTVILPVITKQGYGFIEKWQVEQI